MSYGRRTIPTMATVIDLSRWREQHQDAAPAGLDRLEEAVARLEPLMAAALSARRRLASGIQTEVLAIIGALAMDLVDEAADRADRLASRLAHPGSSARRSG